MKRYDSNILLDQWNDRLESLPESTRAELEAYRTKREMTDELLPIKRKRPKLEAGDVFVVQPKEGLYFYGRVLKAQVDVRFHTNENYKWRDSLIVCVYRNKTAQPTLDDFSPSYDNLLVRPSYVVKNAFHSGYFYKIGHVPFTDEENELDYGFFSTTFRIITDAYGNAIDTMPKLLGLSAVGNFGSIAYKMRDEFIIDPGLLSTEGLARPTDVPDISSTDEEYEEEEELSEDELAAMRTHTLEINARLMPFDRGDVYEDSMDGALVKLGVGCVVGSGTYISDAREPTSCDIEIELAEDGSECLERLKEHLRSYEFPKGTVLHLSETEKLDLGILEGLALYLNGTELPEETYRDHDADEVAGRAAGLLGEAGRYFSCWTGPAETALYFYGKSFKEMKRALRPLVKKHPLCRKCRVVRIA